MIKLVIFDMDETIVHNKIPFSELRERIMKEVGGEDEPKHLYEYLKGMGDEYVRILEREEVRRAESSYPDEHLLHVLLFLKDKGIRVAVVTRNSREATEIALGDYISLFDSVITRDDGFPPKPSPDAILYLLNRFSARGEETMVVGDYDYDIDAGRKAGCITVRLGSGDGDYRISALVDIIPLIRSLG